MRIDQIAFEPWGDAWRCRHNDLELIATAGLSPRIVSFSRDGGENILYHDAESRFGRGSWRLLGGHRLWAAPETESTYENETGPCKVVADADRLVISCGPGASLLRRHIEISASDRGPGFRIRHEIENEGAYPITAAPWAITCVKPAGRITIPWGAGPESWRMQTVRYWRQWGPLSTDPASPQWQAGRDEFVIEPRGEWGKIGLASEGPITHETPAGTFVKRFEMIPNAVYPDGGCNVAVCTASDYVELETLGPLNELAPGSISTHDEHWELTEPH